MIKIVKRPEVEGIGCKGRRSRSYDDIWQAVLRTQGTQDAVRLPRSYAPTPKRMQQFRNGIRHRASYTEPRPGVRTFLDDKHVYLWLVPHTVSIPKGG